MRLLVTGATGFVGSHFANAAIAAGHEVLALRRPSSLPRLPVAQGVQWIEKPLGGLAPADCKRIDALVHFSSHGVSPQRTTWLAAFQHNVVDQLHAIHVAADSGVKRFILCGSCLEYGPAAAEYEKIPPTADLRPRGPYAASKAAGCVAAMALARTQSLQMAYLRVFNAFGEGQHPDNLWPSLREAALAGADYPMTPGMQIRDFLPVSQATATFLDVCSNRPLAAGVPEVHNVGSGHPTTVLAFAQHWWGKWHAKGRLVPGALPYLKDEVMHYVPELTL